MLFVAFILMLVFVFAVVAVFTRPTNDQKAVHGRMVHIRTPLNDAGLPVSELDQLLKESAEGRFGWIEELLHSFSFAQRMQLLIMQANSNATVGSVAAWSAAIGVIGLMLTYLLTGMLPVALPVGLAGGYAPVALLTIKRKRRMAAFDAALPEVIDTMARSLRAGHSMIAAIGVIGEHAVEPAGSEFREVFRKQNFGVSLRDALMQLLDRIPSQDLRVVVTGILVQKDTGGNLVEILERTVHVIRERLRIQGEIRTHTAQGRMTGWILCALPIVMLGLINLINPGYSHVLFYDSFGRKMLYVGVALLCTGGFIIRKIINGIEV